jgi:hypothetical protein
MPLNYPLKHRYYFCDESSFINDEFMGIAGLVILEGSIPMLTDELAKIRRTNGARGEIKWNNISKHEKQARIDFIDISGSCQTRGASTFTSGSRPSINMITTITSDGVSILQAECSMNCCYTEP